MSFGIAVIPFRFRTGCGTQLWYGNRPASSRFLSFPPFHSAGFTPRGEGEEPALFTALSVEAESVLPPVKGSVMVKYHQDTIRRGGHEETTKINRRICRKDFREIRHPRKSRSASPLFAHASTTRRRQRRFPRQTPRSCPDPPRSAEAGYTVPPGRFCWPIRS